MNFWREKDYIFYRYLRTTDAPITITCPTSYTKDGKTARVIECEIVTDANIAGCIGWMYTERTPRDIYFKPGTSITITKVTRDNVLFCVYVHYEICTLTQRDCNYYDDYEEYECKDGIKYYLAVREQYYLDSTNCRCVSTKTILGRYIVGSYKPTETETKEEFVRCVDNNLAEYKITTIRYNIDSKCNKVKTSEDVTYITKQDSRCISSKTNQNIQTEITIPKDVYSYDLFSYLMSFIEKLISFIKSVLTWT